MLLGVLMKKQPNGLTIADIATPKPTNKTTGRVETGVVTHVDQDNKYGFALPLDIYESMPEGLDDVQKKLFIRSQRIQFFFKNGTIVIPFIAPENGGQIMPVFLGIERFDGRGRMTFQGVQEKSIEGKDFQVEIPKPRETIIFIRRLEPDKYGRGFRAICWSPRALYEVVANSTKISASSFAGGTKAIASGG